MVLGEERTEKLQGEPASPHWAGRAPRGGSMMGCSADYPSHLHSGLVLAQRHAPIFLPMLILSPDLWAGQEVQDQSP